MGVGGVGPDPAHLCVSGCVGRWLPGPAAGSDPARRAGANASGVVLGRVSAPEGWEKGRVGRRGRAGQPELFCPSQGPRPVPHQGNLDSASSCRAVLQTTCCRTLEVTRTALLFLSSSLGTERWVSCPRQPSSVSVL